MRLVYAERNSNRQASFEFLNRQMVWHAFTVRFRLLVRSSCRAFILDMKDSKNSASFFLGILDVLDAADQCVKAQTERQVDALACSINVCQRTFSVASSNLCNLPREQQRRDGDPRIINVDHDPQPLYHQLWTCLLLLLYQNQDDD